MLSDLEEKRNLCGDWSLQFGKGSKDGPCFQNGQLSRQMHDARVNVESSVEASGASPHGVLVGGEAGTERAVTLTHAWVKSLYRRSFILLSPTLRLSYRTAQ
jgi:hypothetical protein